jgi:UDP-N-acetylmuramoyl-tripeptide--D-alanyl-D-alanine ligase
MEIEKIYQLYLRSTGVCTDTRRVVSGNLFVALGGENFDGNSFAANAIEKGCTCAIIDKAEYATSNKYVLVENCLETLQQLATFHRNQLTIPVIGITGTNGKTTTKELIAGVLARKFKVLYTQGNLNNHIGVPLTLLRITREVEIAIIEMGANHPNEINFLCNIARPNYGIITNIGRAHLEGFGGFEGVKKTKNELYKFIIEKRGTIVYNSENPILSSLLEGKTVNRILFGKSQNSICFAENVTSDPFLKFTLNGRIEVETKLAGIYNLENALAAATFGLLFKVPVNEICAALEAYEPSNQRSQIKQSGKNLLILDHYNANPSSMEVALDNFAKIAHPKKAVILGDMLELGDDSALEHQKIVSKLLDIQPDKIILVGENFISLSPEKQIIYFHNSMEAKEWVEVNKLEGYAILIKGSRGTKLENIVEIL